MNQTTGLIVAFLAAASAATAQSTGDRWDDAPGLPSPVGPGGAMVAINASTLYATPGVYDWTYANPVKPGTPTPFYKGTLNPDGSWSWAAADTLTSPLGDASAMCHMPGAGGIWAVSGFQNGGLKVFSFFNLSTQKWEGKPAPPDGSNLGCWMAATSTKVYYIPTAYSFKFYSFDIVSDKWDAAALASPASVPVSVTTALVYPGSDDYLYLAAGYGSQLFQRYQISANSWKAMDPLPAGTIGVQALGAGPAGTLYAATLDGGLCRFDINTGSPTGGTWTRLADTPANWGSGAAIASPSGADLLWCLRGNSSVSNGAVDVWRFSTSQAGFVSAVEPSDMPVDSGGAAIGLGGEIYVLGGNYTAAFRSYSVATTLWTTLPDAPEVTDYGAGMAVDDGAVYILTCGGTTGTVFWKYSPGGAWEVLPVPPFTVGPGCALVNAGPGRFYACRGYAKAGFGGQATQDFYCYIGGQWNPMASLPPSGGKTVSFDQGSSLAFVPGAGGEGDVYALTFEDQGVWPPLSLPRFHKYPTAGTGWVAVKDPPVLPGLGAALCYPGKGDAIYATAGNGTPAFLSYSLLGNAWTSRPGAPGTIGRAGGNFSDEGGGALTWLPGGWHLYCLQGGMSRAFWRYELPNTAPTLAPAGLAQRLLDDSAAIATGATILQAGFIAKVAATDAEGDALTVEIEVKPVASPFANAGVAGPVTQAFSGMARGVGYHWQAQATDSRGLKSAWVGFGGNADLPVPAAADFIIRNNALPAASMMVQSLPSTGLPVAVGGAFNDEVGARFSARVDDSDGDAVEMQVEVQRLGVAFTGTPTVVSGSTAAGGTASVLLPLEEGGYHWRVVLKDAAGEVSVPASFGGNGEGEADFQIFANGSGNDAKGCSASAAAGLAPLALLALLVRRR